MFRKKEENAVKTVKPKNKKRTRRIVALIIVIILIVVLAVRCNMGGDTKTYVDVTEVKTGNVSATLDTSGTVKSEETKVYASPVSATVADVAVEVGDTVAAGDYLITYNTDSLEENYTLAELEAKASKASESGSVTKSNQGTQDKADAEATITDLNTQIANKQGELSTANASLSGCQQQGNTINAQLQQYTAAATAGTLSEADMQTYQQLQQMSTSIANEIIAQQGNVTTKQTELSDLQSKLAEAQTKKSGAEASILSGQEQQSLDYNTQKTELSVSSAESDLSKAKTGIAAEFNGVVTDVSIVNGQVAQEGQTLLTVADSGNMKVEFKVSKYNLEELAVGQKATITFLNQTYEGSVTSISHVATMGDSTTSSSSSTAAMVTAVVHIDNPDASLVIGMDAKINIELGSRENVLVVPLSAVNTNKEGDFVYVVENGIVVKKTIVTGLTSDDSVEVVEGLNAGEQVISTVDATITEGLAVEANPVTEDAKADSQTKQSKSEVQTTEEVGTEAATEIK